MSTHQDNLLQDLTKCTVAIENPDNGKVLGAGVIVTDDWLLLTCYHILQDIRTKTIHKTVHVYFPSAPNFKGYANLSYYEPSLDIAFLQLQEKLAEQVGVANLSESVEDGNTFKSFGFRRPTEIKGLNAAGEIRGRVHKRTNEDTTSQELIQLHSDEIGPGMSGAPVLDKEISRVIGIVSEHYRSQSDVDNKLSFAIPVESIVKVYPELKQKNPGLRILEFLRKIGAEGIKKYERINDLFVPPLEYEEIKDILAKHRMVFITGTKEYGKTYTAIRLLWEYFNKGYEPKWYSIEQEKIEGSDIQNRMLKIENLLKEHHIILFDDPFGKTEYEGNEELERAIKTINDAVENTEDAYVIITSREEVFKEFVRISGYDPKNLEVKMNLKTPSYDYEKRKEMLLKWAEVYNCKWLSDDDLKTMVLEAIKDKTKLPTSLNIQNFAYATKKTTADLSSKINEKSQETAWSFANEIKNMTKDKILFLSFPFISDRFSVDFIKAKYQELINELDIKKSAWIFERVFYHFKDDKIDISGNKVRFSHPSYSEALPYLLLENGFPTEINTEIFSNVLMNLYIDKIYITEFNIAYTIADNFDKLPENVRNILFNLADDKMGAWYVADPIAGNFDKLPENVQYLLFKLADNEHAASSVEDAVVNNFDKLPENIRNELLLKLAKPTALKIAFAIIDNFNKLPADVRNKLLIKLVDEHIPEYVAAPVATAIASNFDKLSPNVQNLLFKLADNKNAVGDVAYAIASNSDRLPEKVQNLLFKLADDTAYSIALAVSSNFDKLPEKVQNLLFKLANNKKTAGSVADAIVDRFYGLPKNIRSKLLLKLADNKETARSVANAIADRYRHRNELLREEKRRKEKASKH